MVRSYGARTLLHPQTALLQLFRFLRLQRRLHRLEVDRQGLRAGAPGIYSPHVHAPPRQQWSPSLPKHHRLNLSPDQPAPGQDQELRRHLLRISHHRRQIMARAIACQSLHQHHNPLAEAVVSHSVCDLDSSPFFSRLSAPGLGFALGKEKKMCLH